MVIFLCWLAAGSCEIKFRLELNQLINKDAFEKSQIGPKWVISISSQWGLVNEGTTLLEVLLLLFPTTPGLLFPVSQDKSHLSYFW